MNSKYQQFRSTFKFSWESDLRSAVMSSLHLAKKEFRIRIGLKSSLKLLECDPSSVVMVILPVSDGKDPLSHVQLMLIEAFCNENKIRLLQVRGSEALWSAVTPVADADNEDDDLEEETDISLILIQAHLHEMSFVDSELQKIYDSAYLHYNTRPIIHLPS